MGRARSPIDMPKLIYVFLVVSVVTVNSLPFTRIYSVPPQLHQVKLTAPPTSSFYEPFKFFEPTYNFDFTSAGYQPQLPPFFADSKPLNETTEKPSVEITTPALNFTDLEQPSKLDFNETSLFDNLFKKTSAPISFDFPPSQEFYFPDPYIYTPLESKVVIPPPQYYESFPSGTWNDINKAYGLADFRPFYYNQFIRTINGTNCSETLYDNLFNRPPPDQKDLEKEEKIKADIADLLAKMYKPEPDAVIFKSEDTPIKTDQVLDVRQGERKMSDGIKSGNDLFYETYKDIMFINKSFFTTVAPYLH